MEASGYTLTCHLHSSVTSEPETWSIVAAISVSFSDEIGPPQLPLVAPTGGSQGNGFPIMLFTERPTQPHTTASFVSARASSKKGKPRTRQTEAFDGHPGTHRGLPWMQSSRPLLTSTVDGENDSRACFSRQPKNPWVGRRGHGLAQSKHAKVPQHVECNVVVGPSSPSSLLFCLLRQLPGIRLIQNTSTATTRQPL